MLLTVISPSLFYRKLTSHPMSPDSSFSFRFHQYFFPSVFLLVNPFNFLQLYWLRFFTLGSSDKLIRAKFSISFCTENSMINVTETAVSHFLHFYWYSIHFFFSNNFSSKYLLTLTQTSIEMTPDSHLIFKHFYFSSDNEKMRGILPNNFCCDTKDLGRGTHVGANLIGVANPLHVI